MERPPYFDWRLDRWKIGVALLLLLGLLVLAPGTGGPAAPQGASPVARPGQRPVVGSSSVSVAEPTSSATPVALSALTIEPTPTPSNASVPVSTESISLTLAILEPGIEPLGNSTPLFYGQTVADGRMELLLEGRRYAVLADENGYWQYAPNRALPVGMTWIQARGVAGNGEAETPWASLVVVIDVSAQPVAPPAILAPLAFRGLLDDPAPVLSGVGQAGSRLLFYGRPTSARADALMGETTVGADGAWRWSARAPLPPGRTWLWAVVVDADDRPLTRSWPISLDVGPQTEPRPGASAPDPTPTAVR